MDGLSVRSTARSSSGGVLLWRSGKDDCLGEGAGEGGADDDEGKEDEVARGWDERYLEQTLGPDEGPSAMRLEQARALQDGR